MLQAIGIAEACDVLYRTKQALHQVHFALRGTLQEPADEALERLEEEHGKKQQNCRSGFRRKIGFKPHTGTTDKAEVEQGEKGCEYGVNKISLAANLQKVVLFDAANQPYERQKRARADEQVERRGALRAPAQAGFMQNGQADANREQGPGQHAMEILLALVRRGLCKTRLPNSAAEDRNKEPNRKQRAESAPRDHEVRAAVGSERCGKARREEDRRRIRRENPAALCSLGEFSAHCRIFGIQVQQQGRQKPETGTNQNPREQRDRFRRLRIIKARIERQKRSRCQKNKAEIGRECHCAPGEFYAGSGSRAITKCRLLRTQRNLLIIRILYSFSCL